MALLSELRIQVQYGSTHYKKLVKDNSAWPRIGGKASRTSLDLSWSMKYEKVFNNSPDKKIRRERREGQWEGGREG